MKNRFSDIIELIRGPYDQSRLTDYLQLNQNYMYYVDSYELRISFEYFEYLHSLLLRIILGCVVVILNNYLEVHKVRSVGI